MDSPADATVLAVIDQIKSDYSCFPNNQSYELYADNVYFKDPMNEFYGVERYRRMIGFIQQWFQNIELDLDTVEQPGTNLIVTRWTLYFTAPFPWHPRVAIPGWSELQLDSQGLICFHIDYWNCSRWDVIKQVLNR